MRHFAEIANQGCTLQSSTVDRTLLMARVAGLQPAQGGKGAPSQGRPFARLPVVWCGELCGETETDSGGMAGPSRTTARRASRRGGSRRKQPDRRANLYFAL